MGIINNYPYTDMHSINLDYVIKLCRENMGLHLEISGDRLLLKTEDGKIISSVVIPYATEANHAASATHATNADTATVAINANYASASGSSATADNAANATHAVNADHATSDDSATTAASAASFPSASPQGSPRPDSENPQTAAYSVPAPVFRFPGALPSHRA